MRNYTFIRFAILVALSVCVMVAFTGCIRYGYVPSNVLKQYYLGDEKYSAHNYEDEDFTDDMVIIVFKRSLTNYKPKPSDFSFYNIKSIDFINDNPSTGRHIAFVYLKQKGRDKVLEAVKYFDSLSIVQSVEANVAYGGC